MTSSSAQKGRTSNFDPAKLIVDYQDGIWRYLRAMGCEAALAEDLTQETFLKILQRPFDDYDAAATAAYLRRIARNLYISHQRRAGKVIAAENVQEFETAWVHWVRDSSGDEFVDALAACLEHLSERARQALALRFRDHLSRTEIAEHLEISEHGAKNLMQRAKQQLRDCVERKVNSDALEI